MTKQALSEKLSNFVEHYRNAFMVGIYKKPELIYTNKTATNLFGITTEETSINSLFTHADKDLKQKVKEGLETQDLLVFNDVPVKNKAGDLLLCDIQLGFFDKDKNEVFLEITPKDDDRMRNAMSQVKQSTRAEGILNFDEKLSLIYGNEHFMNVFEADEETRYSHFGNDFSNGFQPDIRTELLAEIHENLKKSTHFSSKMKVITRTGEELWYSLELQRRTLDDSGVDKIMAYLINIEKEVEKDEKIEDINQYFNILQSMSNGLLYRFDIHSRTLYRNENTAKLYGVPTVAKNFPTKKWLDKVLHPDDIQGFTAYIDTVVSGAEGSFTARFRTPEGDLEYHLFTFMPIYYADCSIKEMVGCATNVHNLKETQKELENVNQYFQILQTMSQSMLYRFDIKNRIMYRNKTNAHSYLLPSRGENYPDIQHLKNVIHPDDLQNYVDFIETVIKGKEGSFETRVKSQEGEYEFYKMTFKALRQKDGSVNEMLGTAQNIHKIKRTEQELKNINQYFFAIQELSDDLLYRIDIKNRALIRREKTKNQPNLFGANIVATNFPESVVENGYIHPDDEKNYLEFGHRALEGHTAITEVRMKSKTGEFGFRRILCVPVFEADGSVKEMLGKVVNIQGVRELEEQANFDSLTKVLNKRSMLEYTGEILAQSTNEEKHALLFMDLDDFKYVNDNLGHIFGDFLLSQLGKRLKECIRQDDFIGRVGGEEFVIFLRDIPNTEILMGKAKMLLSAISEDFSDGNIHHNIHASIGVSIFPDHGATYEELYHHADLALYRSKHEGKNIVTLYHEDMKNS